MAVLDARAIAASALVLTPLGTSWLIVSPATLDAHAGLRHRKVASAGPESGPSVFILGQPGFAVSACLPSCSRHRPQARAASLGRFAVDTELFSDAADMTRRKTCFS